MPFHYKNRCNVIATSQTKVCENFNLSKYGKLHSQKYWKTVFQHYIDSPF